MARKNKIDNTVTPKQVADLGFKHEVKAAADKGSGVYEHFHSQEVAEKIANAKKRRRRYGVIFGFLVGTLLIMYIISMLLTQWGDLVIQIGNLQQGKSMMLFEDSELQRGQVKLNGGSVKEVTNITKNWLPKDLDKSKGGQHNGDNYLAYTFYLKNTGDEGFDYHCDMNITGVAKSADEACRVMIYRNGKEQVFAKGQYENRKKAETDATKWVNNTTVTKFDRKDFKTGTTDKYTVVIWIEGNDKECVDAIRGGHVRMNMIFSTIDDEESSSSVDNG